MGTKSIFVGTRFPWLTLWLVVNLNNLQWQGKIKALKTRTLRSKMFIFSNRHDVKANRPVLKEYMERIKSELQPHYDDVHKIVYQMRDKFGGKVPGLEAKL